jgi:ribosomal protein S21
MNRGIRVEEVSDILRELHSLEYFEEMINRECRLAAGEARGTLKRGL